VSTASATSLRFERWPQGLKDQKFDLVADLDRDIAALRRRDRGGDPAGWRRGTDQHHLP